MRALARSPLGALSREREMEADGLAKSESWRLSSPFPRWLWAQSDTEERPICFAVLGLPRAPGYLADPGPAQCPIPQPAGSFVKGFRCFLLGCWLVGCFFPVHSPLGSCNLPGMTAQGLL